MLLPVGETAPFLRPQRLDGRRRVVRHGGANKGSNVMAEHVNCFTADTLRRLVARAPELEVVALRSTHFNPVVIWQDWRGRGRRVPDAERVALLKRTTAWKQRGGLARWCHRAAEGCLGAARLADNLVLVARRVGGR